MKNYRTVVIWGMALILLSSCSYVPKFGKKSDAPPAETTQTTVKSKKMSDANKGVPLLTAGISQYEAGEYELAENNLKSALTLGLIDPTDQITAHKYLAFLYCVSGLEALCQMEFAKIFDIDPKFTLSPAETGHPIWQPVYDKAKNQTTGGQKKP